MTDLTKRLERLEARSSPSPCSCVRVIYESDTEERPLCPHGRAWASVVRVIYDKVPRPTWEGSTP